jgi:molybdopterin adenylyltransferase
MTHEHITQPVITAAVITVSSSRNADLDISGQTIKSLLDKSGIPIAYSSIVPDSIAAIRTAFYEALPQANCIIFNGGTGLTHDDYTIEAITPLLEKRVEGFGELFRMKSFEEIGVSTILSRALAGTVDGKAVFCIPGSPKAVQLATSQIIIPVISHMISHASR